MVLMKERAREREEAIRTNEICHTFEIVCITKEIKC